MIKNKSRAIEKLHTMAHKLQIAGTARNRQGQGQAIDMTSIELQQSIYLRYAQQKKKNIRTKIASKRTQKALSSLCK